MALIVALDRSSKELQPIRELEPVRWDEHLELDVNRALHAK
jgi:hypothetical protein